jgi:hypothetical protein
MNTPSVTGRSMSMSASSSTIPRQLPTVVTFRYQDQRKVVTLPESHEAAQDTAARSFPSLANVDPSWLQFSIAVRYRTTGERKEYPIRPESWNYVTSKLVAYRCIDVYVVPSRSPEGTPSSLASSLLPDTPPRQHDPPFLFHRPSSSHGPQYYAQLPPVDDDDNDDHHRPSYPEQSPVTPPPKHPGSFGYGFSWGPNPNLRPPPLYVQPRTSSPYSTYGGGGGGRMDDAMDRRGPPQQRRPGPGGWSINASVGFPASASPARTHSSPLSRVMSLSIPEPPSPTYSHVPLPPGPESLPHRHQQHSGATSLRLFSSIRRVLPGGSRSWASESAARPPAPSPSSSSRWGRRQRRNSQPARPSVDSDYEEEEDYSEVATRSGRSYVPSLI